VATARRRALKALKSDGNSASIEHLVLRYLTAAQGDEGSGGGARLLDELLRSQNNNGGWGWRLDGPSDALGTGYALYGLSFVEPQRREPAVQRAWDFLAQTQRSNAAWNVPSTLEEKHGAAYVVANDWGTAWAVIGLTRTLGASHAEPQRVESAGRD